MFFMLNSTEYEIYLLIMVKMSTIVGILTFMSRINTIYVGFKTRKIFIFQPLRFYEQLKFHVQLSLA